MPLEILRIPNGKWNENCYLIVDQSKKAIVIDPGDGETQLLLHLKQKGIKRVLAILNTHAHFDHIASIDSLKKRLCSNFYLHSKDMRLLNHANLYHKVFQIESLIEIPKVDFYLDKQPNPLVIGNFRIETIFTPGHSKGSVCFKIDNALFTGDTLLKGKIGRIDLPGGNEDGLRNSLKELSNLDPELIIYPGHGEETTLYNEIKFNSEFRKAIS